MFDSGLYTISIDFPRKPILTFISIICRLSNSLEQTKGVCLRSSLFIQMKRVNEP